MRKLFTLLMCIVAIAYSQDLQSVVAGSQLSDAIPPQNVAVIALTNSNVAEASDTLATTEYNIYGPYDLAQGGFMFKGFQIHYPDAFIASGDSIITRYMITPTNSIADSIAYSSYTAVDTVDGATGGMGAYTDLSSNAGSYIWFQVYNMDATSVEIAKPIRVTFKRDETKNK